MIKDLLVSFKDNIKSKTANPFFGTLIIVWLFRNYKFVYTIFTFEKSKLPGTRLNYISSLFEPSSFIPNLFLCIGYAVCVLIVTYILLNLSRFIVLWFEKRITPHIYEFTDSDLIVTVDKFNEQKEESKRIQNRFEQEQRTKLQLQSDYDNLEERYKLLLSASNNIIDSEKSEKSESNQDNSPTIRAQKLFQKYKPYLDNTELVKNYRMVSLNILKGTSIKEKEVMDDLLVQGLIEITTRSGGSVQYNNYKFTKKGEAFREILNHMDETGKVIIRSLDDMV